MPWGFIQCKSCLLYTSTSDIDLVFVEHEYGIFGGNDGAFVLDFVENLEKPFILNTHTVLPSPDFQDVYKRQT